MKLEGLLLLEDRGLTGVGIGDKSDQWVGLEDRGLTGMDRDKNDQWVGLFSD